ncbi:hydroxyacid dehydrogenase [Methylobacterium sp. J-001]|uniref:hydroxyacid dehydrogenase n=1 Tax=Methylobacterium sp. J-001 TaxID=2836609 RepID=UPI001FB9E6F3|nr:hydroxyacid dehydrogenase [Methylobacterium sp. J-001]MCJ2120758.1 hydroxyacid dehydrogenase [Methylobacterium sp. J-001]
MALKRVCRFNLWINPVFDARLRAEPDIDLQVGDLQGPAETLKALLTQAHVFHVSPARDELPRRWHVTDELLAGCPNLLAVSSGGAGFDTVDTDACTRAGVAVVNQVGGNARSVAELAIGLMLAVSRKICVSDRLLRTARGFSRESLMGHEIGGSTLGLVGIGHTGREVAKLARGFDMRVLAYDPLLSAEEIRARGAEPVDRAQLLAESDIVSLHCPLDATTRGSFDANAFAAMKPGALFITTARGGVHDEAALAGALAFGHLAGAGLDVWAPEPPPLDSALLKLDTVVATYHTAGVTHEARRNVASWGADQIIGLLRGETPPRLVNPEVWPAVLARRMRLLGPA